MSCENSGLPPPRFWPGRVLETRSTERSAAAERELPHPIRREKESTTAVRGPAKNSWLVPSLKETYAATVLPTELACSSWACERRILDQLSRGVPSPIRRDLA